jgi:hypothetical protein
MSYVVDFTYQGASASLEVWDDGKTATLATIHSKFRKRGAGRKVLALVLQYADALDLTLLLEVVPFGDEPRMSAPELKALYMSVGFVSQGGSIMKREPIRAQELEVPSEQDDLARLSGS